MKLKLLITASIACIFWMSCKSIYPSAQIPTYVHIDSFAFDSSSKSLTTSHNICCAWVYYNNNPVGIFNLPVTFPVITSGAGGALLVAPTIEVAGQSSFQVQYPFYTFDTTTLHTKPGQTVQYTPHTTYTSSTSVQPIENFEVGSSFVPIDLSNDTLTRVTDPTMVFEGKGSGYIYVNGPQDSSVNATRNTFTIKPVNAYIELNYKGTDNFFVGCIGDVSGIAQPPFYLAGFYPTATWTKIYIPISAFTQAYPTATDFRLVIKTTAPSSQSGGYILLDNIQYVTD